MKSSKTKMTFVPKNSLGEVEKSLDKSNKKDKKRRRISSFFILNFSLIMINKMSNVMANVKKLARK